MEDPKPRLQPPGGFGAQNVHPIGVQDRPAIAKSWQIWPAVVVGTSIFAILLLLGVVGYWRKLRDIKGVEAMNNLGQINVDAVNQFEAAKINRYCASASTPVPNHLSSNTEYAPNPAVGHDYQADVDLHAGFSCIGFSSDYQAYQYDYRSDGPTFDGIAREDWNQDGIVTRFHVRGTAEKGHAVSGQSIDRTEGRNE